MSEEVKFSTTPLDIKHFPATNQAHYCWQKYNEYVLCVNKNGGDEDKCLPLRRFAQSICLNQMIEDWDEARANGKFIGVRAKAAHGDDHHHH